MTARRHRKEPKVEVVWEINPDPAPCELNQWHRFWGRLFEPALKKVEDGPKDSRALSLPLRESSQAPSKTTFRCKRCGKTWPAKYLPDGSWDPDWWKCPNECYKCRENKDS